MQTIVKNKFIWLSVIGLLAVLSVIMAFSHPKESPSETVLTFQGYVKDYNIEKAKGLVTTEVLQGFENGTYAHYGTFAGYMKDFNSAYAKYEPISEKINGNSASVKVNIIYKNGMKKQDTVLLEKEDGIWKIAE